MRRSILSIGTMALASLSPITSAIAQAPFGSRPNATPTYVDPPAPIFDDAGVKRWVASGSIDGKVAGLSADSFTALQAIKRANPNGTLTEANAMQLRSAMVRDQFLDGPELDLLQEMTQSQFRGITVTLAGSDTTKVVTYPTSGMAKKVLQETLYPRLNLVAAWAQGSAGWNQIAKAYKAGPLEEVRVVNFVAAQLEAEWAKSNQANAYKPVRDLIARLYGYSGVPGADTNTGRTILYKATKQVDANAKDAVPDFLYNWTRPGGYM